MAVAIGGETPRILLRRRLVLTKGTGTNQPYHAAREMGPKQGLALVERTAAAATRMAEVGLGSVKEELNGLGFKPIAAGILLGASRPKMAFESIVASHPLVHWAEGVLYRDAVSAAALLAKIPLTGVREKDLMSDAAKTLRLSEADIGRRLQDFKRDVGPPWRQDEKYAALVAWIALRTA
jgi:hypothetical protein